MPVLRASVPVLLLVVLSLSLPLQPCVPLCEDAGAGQQTDSEFPDLDPSGNSFSAETVSESGAYLGNASLDQPVHDLGSPFIGGDVITTCGRTSYLQLNVSILSGVAYADDAFLFESQYRVREAGTAETFLDALSTSSVAVIHSAPSESEGADNSDWVLGLSLDWVSRGNLLIVDGAAFLPLGIMSRLGIAGVHQTVAAGQVLNVDFVSGPLTFNLPAARFTIDDSVDVFALVPSCPLVAAAFVADQDGNTSPAALVGRIGWGYVLLFGFSLESASACRGTIRAIINNAIRFCCESHLTLRTPPFSIRDSPSPHLYVMDSSSPLLQTIATVADRFWNIGFNVYYSNLLSSDYRGGFYGSISLTAPLSRVVGVFSSGLSVQWNVSSGITLDEGFEPPWFALGVFDCCFVDAPASLCWPAGWAPPSPDYYHLAPDAASVEDMGADQWVPHSVEDALQAHAARAEFGCDGTGIDVAVIDTGFSNDQARHLYPEVDDYHPYYEEYYAGLLQNRYYSYQTNNHNPGLDYEGHGTAIVANLLAVAPGITLHMVSWDNLVEAFDIVLALNPDIVSCSWSAGPIPTGPSELQSRVRQAAQNGIIVIFAAGNGATIAWPGCEPCVVSAGGVYVDETGGYRASSYAASGSVDQFAGRIVPDFCGIVGQGEGGSPKEHGILIEMPTEPKSFVDDSFSSLGDETAWYDGWAVASGTSSAAPQIAGFAALVKQLDADTDTSSFQHLVMSTCKDVSVGQTASGYTAKDGWDRATGAGLVNVYSAIRTLVEYSSHNRYDKATFPSGKSVNFQRIWTPYGYGYHIDTAGTTEYGFTFMGYLASRTQAVMVNQEGFLVTGLFRQYDTFKQSDWPGRRMLNLYVLSTDCSHILQTVTILDYDDGTDWVFRSFEVALPSDFWGMVRIAFGRPDQWQSQWSLTAEWVAVSVYTYGWWNETSPAGKYVEGHPLPPSDLGYQTGYHVDTIANYQERLYYFYAHPVNYAPYFLIGEVDISVTGWFRQYDTLPSWDWSGRRYVDVYVIHPDTLQVVKSQRILQYYDGTDWSYRHVHFKMPWAFYLHEYYIVIGRYDSWSSPWQLTAEIFSVQITVGIPY